MNSDYWVFTTIKSPWDGTHPVSGNRLFGYEIDSDNNMILYTRGVDRVNLPFFNYLDTLNNPAYKGADKLWESL